MDDQDRRRYVKRELLKRRNYQFGQNPATVSLATDRVSGDVACADTSIQLAVQIVKKRFYSINYVRRKSGNRYHVPMNVGNAVLALRRMGLPYERRSNLSVPDLMRISLHRGPVLVAEDYWAHPQWKGYKYLGHTQNGYSKTPSGKTVQVGFAHPLQRSGQTQHTFKGGHMVLLATAIERRGGKWIGFVRDPNHHSAARPERPAWDEVTAAQLRRMIRSFDSPTYIVPTEVLIR